MSPRPGSRSWPDRARLVARTGSFAAVSLVVIPPFALHMRATRAEGADRDRLRDAWVGTWARGLLRLCAFDLALHGRLPPPRPGVGRVIVANHRSALDIPAMLAAFGGAMVSRADLADWPLLGLGAKAADTIFVDRDLAQSGALTLRVVQRRLAAGCTVHLFPEGTTFDGDEVRPFRAGAFVAALAAKAEILPVGLAYPAAARAAFVQPSFPAHLAELARGPRSRIGIAVGEPIVAAPGERAKPLAARVQAVVQELVERARGVVGP